MIYDLQKAGMLKRISAYVLDVILLIVLVTGIAWVLSIALGYDTYNTSLSESYKEYEQEYGISFDITAEELSKLPAEEMKKYEDANAAMLADDEVMYAYTMLFQLSLVIATIGILLGYIALEFVVPLILGNGQTLGKKVFGLALMRTNGVKVSSVSLFIRTILGKYTIETMIPVLIFLMIFFGTIGVIAPLIIGAILVVQIVLLIVTRTNSAIHDLLADTVVVDLTSQMIFDSEEALIAYKKKVAAEKSARQDY